MVTGDKPVVSAKGSMLAKVLIGILGVGLLASLILYSSQISKTNAADSKVSSLTLDLGTANGKITTLTTDLGASNAKVTSLTGDLATANGKVTSLTTDLGAANAKVTSLTTDLNTANGRVTSLTADLATANGRVTSLTASLSTANANITQLSADLATAKANVAKITADLATANANVTKLNADLAAANANVTKLTADLAASQNETESLVDQILVMGYPSHFENTAELDAWLAQDNTNTQYAPSISNQYCYILQIKALRGGYLVPWQYGVTSNGTIVYGNVAYIQDINEYHWIYSKTDNHTRVLYGGTALPLYPIIPQ